VKLPVYKFQNLQSIVYIHKIITVFLVRKMGRLNKYKQLKIRIRSQLDDSKMIYTRFFWQNEIKDTIKNVVIVGKNSALFWFSKFQNCYLFKF